MGVLDVIFPKTCFSCGKSGGYFCPSCVAGMERREAVCPMCSFPSVGGRVHGRCRRALGIDRLIVPFRYTGGLQKALKRVKYSSSWDVVSRLVDVLIGAVFEELNLDTSWVVSAVPLSISKERSRGFNQAEAMGVLLARSFGLRYVPLLSRKRSTRAQYGLGRKEREENVRGAFSIKTNNQLPKRVILVDDVWTTGATMKECCRVLKRNGVCEVWGAALAR